MNIQVVALQDLLNNYSEDFIQDILNKFKSIPNHESPVQNDVECFLHKKAIEFEKMSWATTHLVFVENDELILAGYFSLANRPLKISEKNFKKLSNTQRKKLLKYGSKEEKFIEINSFLIGQLGKNYNVDDSIKNIVTGKYLLSIAYEMLASIVKVVKVKYVWLECENHPKLIDFYTNFGFTLIENYEGTNELKVLIMKLE